MTTATMTERNSFNDVLFDTMSASVPGTLDTLTRAELDVKLQHSYEQSLAGEGRPYREVFDELEGDIA